MRLRKTPEDSPKPDVYKPDVDKPESFMDPRWLTAVATTRDSDLRTHRIALTYSKLAEYVDQLIYGDLSVSRQLTHNESVTVCNANWFHFATWATVTITRNIANERPPQRVDTLPTSALRRQLTPAIVQARAASGQRVSRSLSWGQRMVFVSTCFPLESFRDTIGQPGPLDVPKEAVDTIKELSTWDGFGWIDPTRHLPGLRKAFGFYKLAHAQRDSEDTTARLMLGANVLIAAIEQDIIGPAVDTVVNHIPRRVTAGLDTFTAKWVERFRGIPSQITRLNLPYLYEGARSALDTAWSRLMTDQVFVMTLPTETLRLGRDIPPRHAERPFYPKALRSLAATSDPGAVAVATELDEIAALVNSFDRTIGNGRGSAARDWRRWDERVNWAVTLMRSRQQDETLFWSPYSQEDQRRIVVGELPRRGGDPTALEVQAPSGAVVLAADETNGEGPP